MIELIISCLFILLLALSDESDTLFFFLEESKIAKVTNQSNTEIKAMDFHNHESFSITFTSDDGALLAFASTWLSDTFETLLGDLVSNKFPIGGFSKAKSPASTSNVTGGNFANSTCPVLVLNHSN